MGRGWGRGWKLPVFGSSKAREGIERDKKIGRFSELRQTSGNKWIILTLTAVSAYMIMANVGGMHEPAQWPIIVMTGLISNRKATTR